MCLGIPMQVVEADSHRALCLGRGGLHDIDTLITGPLRTGQWVLCFLDAAREIIDAERAAQISHALDALESLQSGDADIEAVIGSHFADLINREPQLPDFLRPPTTQEPQA